jgi:maltose alpha-D-glucosyltransferase/alpha-amylase
LERIEVVAFRSSHGRQATLFGVTHGLDDRLWYKDAIIYELNVRGYLDASGDGIGDLAGLTQKLDYLASLGVTAVWLLPFYLSPLRDGGYDIADYTGVHPAYGTLRDFETFVSEAHRRGLRVITELVLNHTSDQHPWFVDARSSPASRHRDWYVWSDDDRRYAQARIIFTDTETSNWAWDSESSAFYWHRFFSHQPDLNWDNPQVFDAVLSAMRYWLDLGVDGMRLDAVPYLIEREGTSCENVPETHEVLKRLRADLDERHPDRMLLAEANQWPRDVLPYFGNDDECQMAFHFPLMPRIWIALRKEDPTPIIEIMEDTPQIPPDCQWAVFLRNHDELTLEMVTDDEREFLWREYAPDPRARLNLGIRRRLAPLVDNQRDQIQLLNGLLLSLPGTPVIYYGDEIGMGDNLDLPDRDGVRTPMQWTPDRNAGFSSADPDALYAPVIAESPYGYQAVNVAAQERDPGSLLHWMRHIIGIRRQHPVFGRGALEFLRPDNQRVLAYLREHEGVTILCVANFSHMAQPVELDLQRYTDRVPLEMLGQHPYPRIEASPYPMRLDPHAFHWFLLTDGSRPPA